MVLTKPRPFAIFIAFIIFYSTYKYSIIENLFGNFFLSVALGAFYIIMRSILLAFKSPNKKASIKIKKYQNEVAEKLKDLNRKVKNSSS